MSSTGSASAVPVVRRDLVCIGRAAVDLYGEQIGARLEDVTSFARYLGGSPCNTAVGCARLGLSVAMLTRVGDEQNGAFVEQALAREGVDISRVRRDPERLTALVFLGIRSRNVFPLLFYRDNCADMALSADDVDEAFIAESAAVLVSGTHLSRPGVRAACLKAIGAARAAGRKVILDIDYRPVLWGLRPLADGETRYVPADDVTRVLASVLPSCDLIVGTEEEIQIAGGSTDTAVALKQLRERTRAVIVFKRGADGCEIHTPAPDSAQVRHPGFPVEVFNVLGAGDAFMAGFLSGWLRGHALADCARRANACGALVVSRHGCAPAIPSAAELDWFLQQGSNFHRLREDEVLNHLHRVTTRAPGPRRLAVIAFDHRAQFEEMQSQTAGPPGRIEQFKRLIAQAASQVALAARADGHRLSCGLILDDRYGADLLPDLDESGWWIARPVEVPGSRPLRFEGRGNVHAMLRTWPSQHVAKCLVAFDAADDDALRTEQIASLKDLAQACADTQRELLLEVIPPRKGRTGAALDAAVTSALRCITEAGILPDWWKLAPPQCDDSWSNWTEVIRRADPFCRGVLLLGLDAPLEELADQLSANAGKPLCLGFAVGRTIFGDAARGWFEGRMTDAEVIDQVASRYRMLLERFAAAESSTVAASTSFNVAT